MGPRPPSNPSPPLPDPALRALRVDVRGAVQGVGFRPFVHRLATDLGLAGAVRNSPAGVEIVVEGGPLALDAFLARLTADAPPLAFIEDLAWRYAEPVGRTGFAIGASSPGTRVDTLVTADAATCPACLRELFDPGDRRYRYPFTNCTDCGPRFTITLSVPYDRPATTMAPFTMCPECRSEYEDPDDRRFHAQPNACPSCGPSLSFVTTEAGGSDAGHEARSRLPAATGEEALERGAELLKAGGILAVKGLGGYHLACDAADEAAVRTLRARKHRDERPFAVMMADVAQVRRCCEVSPVEEQLLSSARRPIVLLERLALNSAPDPTDGHAPAAGPPDDEGGALAPSLAPGVTTYGCFLPYTPLHHLLLRDTGLALVMTSGNLSNEPIAYRDDEARACLWSLADGLLTHDRAIHMRTDDSVARVVGGEPYLLRRSRGWAPLPITFDPDAADLLAVGAHLKNTFCLTHGRRAFVSHHIGDLDDLRTVRSLEEGVEHYTRLFDLSPTIVAHDMHPDYASTRYAQAYAAEHGLDTLAVQHHEAHIASLLTDSRYPGRVVGVAFDGAGWGPDGTIWGGEFFVGAAGGFERVAHLNRVLLPGGDQAVREPWRIALAALAARAPDDGDELPAGLEREMSTLPAAAALAARPWRPVLAALRRGINTPETTSAGRWFDAVAALLGFRLAVNYEGQAAILLETAARRARARGHGAIPALDLEPAAAPAASAAPSSGAGPGSAPDQRVSGNPTRPAVLSMAPAIEGLLDGLRRGAAPDELAAWFHAWLAARTADLAITLAAAHDVEAVALSGGVFQNTLLLELLTSPLARAGLRVLVHRAVPANDGGLSLGQAAIAAARGGQRARMAS